MVKEIISFLENKKVLILGFGREGKSTYNFIRNHLKNQKLYIADMQEDLLDKNEFLKKDSNIECICGNNYLNGLEDYDIIIKTPGISFKGIDTSKFYSKIKSQLELLLEFFKATTIGITGTKGKSTTSSLIYKVLKDQNIECMLLGNIGVPVFDYLDQIKENMVLVLEMSSHQLEYMEKSPNISILLNIFEEHLDHYESFENYAKAKCNIYKYQDTSDFFLYNVDNKTLNKMVKNNLAKTYKVSLENKQECDIYLKGDEVYFEDEIIYSKNEPRNLLGDYNLNNIMFVLGVAKILKLDINKAIKTISDFKTLEHRLEYVGKYDGIDFYDNSIGTIPEATIEAVKALKNVNSLIIGGMDRNIDYTDFIKFLEDSNIENIICMPKTGHDIAKKIVNKKTFIVNTMEEAVKTAKQVTKKSSICLLSPAAASYGYFKNFEEKGNIYKELVKKK